MRILLIFISFLIFSTNLVAQSDSLKTNDSISAELPAIKKNGFQSRYIQESIAPVSLALGSVAILSIPGLKENLQQKLMWNDDLKPGYINLGEDYVRYAPAVAAYALSFCGVKSQHRFIDKTLILAVSYIASDFVVYNTKNITKSLRPGRPLDNTDYSFPSQHTAMAFVAATFLDHELGYISPWISVGGYVAASYVGYARIARNRHWTSDVLMGAGVGILMTNATYWAYDGVMKLFPKNLIVSPVIDSQQTGLYFCYKF